MKHIIITLALVLASIVCANAQVYSGYSGYSGLSGYSGYSRSTSSYSTGTNSSVRYQSGYTRSNGTYVQGHYKTSSNSTNHD